MGHLKSFEFGQFAVAAQGGHDLAEPFERVVQAVHSSAFPRVGGQSALLDHLDGRHFGGTSPVTAAPVGIVFGSPRRPRLALSLGRRPGRRCSVSCRRTCARFESRRIGFHRGFRRTFIGPKRRRAEFACVRLVLVGGRAVLVGRYHRRRAGDTEKAVISSDWSAAAGRMALSQMAVMMMMRMRLLVATWAKFCQQSRR